MVVNMMVSGKMIKGVDSVFFIKPMDKNMKANGNKIKKNGQGIFYSNEG
jgi:hypothetical protein